MYNQLSTLPGFGSWRCAWSLGGVLYSGSPWFCASGQLLRIQIIYLTLISPYCWRILRIYSCEVNAVKQWIIIVSNTLILWLSKRHGIGMDPSAPSVADWIFGFWSHSRSPMQRINWLCSSVFAVYHHRVFVVHSRGILCTSLRCRSRSDHLGRRKNHHQLGQSSSAQRTLDMFWTDRGLLHQPGAVYLDPLRKEEVFGFVYRYIFEERGGWLGGDGLCRQWAPWT